MADLFTLHNLVTVLVLTALETVLGFDNLLYITIEAKRVAPERQVQVRQLGIILAIALRIVLLFVVLKMIEAFQAPLLVFDTSFVAASANGHSLIVLAGGIFLIYTAMKEIFHMLVVEDLEGHGPNGAARRSPTAALVWIVAMNVVFSFDTVLSAIALTHNFIVMTTAIVVSGALMVALSGHVARFLRKNRMYEVLGLFVLLLVGVLLMSEGGELAHLAFFGFAITAMSKATFYFVVITLVLVDVVQSRYQRKVMAEEARKIAEARAAVM
jgi:predicted tellurium resistance membrane protein TerC